MKEYYEEKPEGYYAGNRPELLKLIPPGTKTLLDVGCGEGGLGLAATINSFAIIDAVNAKLLPHEQFNPFGWYPQKTFRLHREYRRLYPQGGLLRREGFLAAAMLFCIVVVAWLLGLLPRGSADSAL